MGISTGKQSRKFKGYIKDFDDFYQEYRKNPHPLDIKYGLDASALANNLRWYLNHLRAQYDEFVENYIQELLEDGSKINADLIDFSDGFLWDRDKLEWIIGGIKILGHDRDFSWFDRFTQKLKSSDKELRKFLPRMAKYFIVQEGKGFSMSPLFPPSFWWRHIPYELTLKYQDPEKSRNK